MRPAPLFAMLAAIIALATAAVAAPLPPILHGRPRPWQPPAGAARAGMQVAIDPLSGELVPAGPGAIPHAGPSRADALRDLRLITRADGSRYVRLDGRLRAYTVARVASDGSLVEDCVTGERDALARVSADAPRAGKER